MSLGDPLVDLMVYETSFLLVVRVYLDLTVGVRGIKGFAERGWTLVEKMFGIYIVE